MPSNPPLKIAFIGNFAYKKGSQVFAEVVKEMGKECEWYLFGYVGDNKVLKEISQKVQLARAYDDGELPVLLKKHQIDLALILSIWPETFSKTTFEVVSAGVPFLSFDVGYPADFFKNYPLIIPLSTGANGIITKLKTLNKTQLERAKKSMKKTFKTAEHAASVSRKYELIDQLA